MLVVNLSTPEGLTAESRLKEPRAWNGNGARKFDASRHVPMILAIWNAFSWN